MIVACGHLGEFDRHQKEAQAVHGTACEAVGGAGGGVAPGVGNKAWR